MPTLMLTMALQYMNCFRPIRFLVLLALVFGIHAATSAQAQRLGVGAQFGDPSGVTLQVRNEGAPSYDFLGAWSLNQDFLFLNGHLLFENPISAENLDRPFQWFVGPGGFVGVGGGGEVGISGTIGLNLDLTDHVAIYGRITPRLELAPETQEAIGGGLGIRYFL